MIHFQLMGIRIKVTTQPAPAPARSCSSMVRSSRSLCRGARPRRRDERIEILPANAILATWRLACQAPRKLTPSRH